MSTNVVEADSTGNLYWINEVICHANPKST
jgi:hypothetical protein